MNNNSKIFYLLIFILALAVNFSGINVKFFTDDPGLYASIAKNLVYKKEFFELFTYNRDWLDKPHFPFWCVLVSFKLFGISVWAYRLPALLFFVISIVYTWLFTKKYYSREIAAIAVLILATALNTILCNTDVRAEPYLMGLVIGSIYHIACLQERLKFKHLLLGALLTAFAIMTKGIFVITAIYGGLLLQLFFKGGLKTLFQPKWIGLFVLTFIFTLPEFYALYIQFDLHPAKTVFGRQNVSGIRWFLWDSQFGRFVNTGPINRKASGGSVFFYAHTLLWAFAPWGLLFYYAVAKNIKAIYRRVHLAEYYTLGGGLLLLLLFSVSKFQLPFYTNAIFPLFAIITAPVCYQVSGKFGTKFRLAAQWLFVILMPVAILIVNFLLKPRQNTPLIADLLVFGVLTVWVITKVTERHNRVFLLNCLAVLFAGVYLNLVFYDEVIPYKGQIAAGEYISQKSFNRYHLYTLSAENNIFQFYCKRPVDLLPIPVDLLPIKQFNSFMPGDTSIFYANQSEMNRLKQIHADFKVIRSFVDYPRENILPRFIDKATRNRVLDSVYLITR
jgi:4-amino-4-deoxy-L-arabinose transferase-like glycosyltransferase